MTTPPTFCNYDHACLIFFARYRNFIRISLIFMRTMQSQGIEQCDELWWLHTQAPLAQLADPSTSMGHPSPCLFSASTHSGERDLTTHIYSKKRLCMPCKASYIASISQLLCSVVLCIICGRLTHVPITHWTRSTVAAARTLRTCATPHHFTSLSCNSP